MPVDTKPTCHEIRSCFGMVSGIKPSFLSSNNMAIILEWSENGIIPIHRKAPLISFETTMPIILLLGMAKPNTLQNGTNWMQWSFFKTVLWTKILPYWLAFLPFMRKITAKHNIVLKTKACRSTRNKWYQYPKQPRNDIFKTYHISFGMDAILVGADGKNDTPRQSCTRK